MYGWTHSKVMVPMSLQSSTTRLESRNWREGGRRNFGIPFPHPGGTNLTQSSCLGMPTIPKTWNRNSNSRITA